VKELGDRQLAHPDSARPKHEATREDKADESRNARILAELSAREHISHRRRPGPGPGRDGAARSADGSPAGPASAQATPSRRRTRPGRRKIKLAKPTRRRSSRRTRPARPETRPNQAQQAEVQANRSHDLSSQADQQIQRTRYDRTATPARVGDQDHDRAPGPFTCGSGLRPKRHRCRADSAARHASVASLGPVQGQRHRLLPTSTACPGRRFSPMFIR